MAIRGNDASLHLNSQARRYAAKELARPERYESPYPRETAPGKTAAPVARRAMAGALVVSAAIPAGATGLAVASAAAAVAASGAAEAAPAASSRATVGLALMRHSRLIDAIKIGTSIALTVAASVCIVEGAGIYGLLLGAVAVTGLADFAEPVNRR